MKVATISLSGNVGKTTVAKNLLYPRIPDAVVFEFESTNIGIQLKSANIKTVRASSFGDMIDNILVTENAIIDIGASNIEGVLKEMHELDGSHEDIDFFVIPVISDNKIVKESIKTAMMLNALGVPSEKIRILFNRVEKNVDVQQDKDFSLIFKHLKDGMFTANKDAIVFENPVFAELNKLSLSLDELYSDDKDYKQALKEAKNEKEQKHALSMIANKRRATSAYQNLTEVYSVLFA